MGRPYTKEVEEPGPVSPTPAKLRRVEEDKGAVGVAHPRCEASILCNGSTVRCRLGPDHPGWHGGVWFKLELRWPRLPSLRDIHNALRHFAGGCVQQ